jgi:hypothetical protein
LGHGQPQDSRGLFFENYCALNGYDPEYGVRWHERFAVNTDKDFDYLIERVGDRAIVEVKHFETRRMKDQLLATPGRAIYFGGPDLYAKLQVSVRDVSQEQLAPFASVGLPLVVVVTNPMQSDVSFDPDASFLPSSDRSSWRSIRSRAAGFRPCSARTGHSLPTGRTAS